MKVKICGVTSLEEALMCVDQGADMIGFNFYRESSRYIEPGRCGQIISDLQMRRSEAVTVGIFVNHPPTEVQAIVDNCGLDLAQLHGDEPLSALRALAGRAFKAIRPASRAQAISEAVRFGESGPEQGPSLLLDAHRPGKYGGTGARADWSLASEVAASQHLLLAGGLDPENVAAAIHAVRPWGLDVASGVEGPSGTKDPDKIAGFITAARSATREAVR